MDSHFKILVVDDDPINVKMMVHVLKDEYEVVTAPNGKEALVQVKKHKPDLIIMDVMMPVMGGFDASILIKSYESFKHIPIIFITAMDGNEGKIFAMELREFDYLTKPVDFAALKQLMSERLAAKKPL
jgi:putative two-component system response regulator